MRIWEARAGRPGASTYVKEIMMLSGLTLPSIGTANKKYFRADLPCHQGLRLSLHVLLISKA